MNVEWGKCQGDAWCKLANVDLTHEHFNNMEGVYIIWHLGDKPATVRVGQGVIKDRLAAHRNDKAVQAYSAYGLFVTWARVEAAYRDGVEAFVAERLNPIVGDRFPNRRAIEVNLPR